jgi:hypothetical protein
MAGEVASPYEKKDRWCRRQASQPEMSGACCGFSMRRAALSGLMEKHPLQSCSNGHERGSTEAKYLTGNYFYCTYLLSTRQWAIPMVSFLARSLLASFAAVPRC